MKLTTLNVVSPVASISLLIGSDVHHFVFTVLVPVLFREVFSHPYISLFHLLENGFSVTCIYKIIQDLYIYLLLKIFKMFYLMKILCTITINIFFWLNTILFLDFCKLYCI